MPVAVAMILIWPARLGQEDRRERPMTNHIMTFDGRNRVATAARESAPTRVELPSARSEQGFFAGGDEENEYGQMPLYRFSVL